MTHLKKSIITALCLALCCVLPVAFHVIPRGGALFSPIHFPALLCGIVCGPWYGLFCGIAGPALSSLLTGMPAAAKLPPMIIELVFYGMVSGALMNCVRTGKTVRDLYISLISAMIAGRIAAGISKALFFTGGGYTVKLWLAGTVLGTWPGMLLQLVLIPAIYLALIKARVIPERY